MKIMSNYVSLAVLLVVTIMLTYKFASTITGAADHIEKSIKEKESVCINVQKHDQTKYILINKSCVSKIVEILGRYEILANTNEFLVLETKITEKIIIISEDDIIAM